MEITTLAILKSDLNVSTSVDDTKLTRLGDQAELELLDHLGFASADAFETAHGSGALIGLQFALTIMVGQMYQEKPGLTADVQNMVRRYRQRMPMGGETA